MSNEFNFEIFINLISWLIVQIVTLWSMVSTSTTTPWWDPVSGLHPCPSAQLSVTDSPTATHSASEILSTLTPTVSCLTSREMMWVWRWTWCLTYTLMCSVSRTWGQDSVWRLDHQVEVRLEESATGWRGQAWCSTVMLWEMWGLRQICRTAAHCVTPLPTAEPSPSRVTTTSPPPTATSPSSPWPRSTTTTCCRTPSGRCTRARRVSIVEVEETMVRMVETGNYDW